MILKILSIDVCGKAFVEDVDSKVTYYMEQRGDELRPAEDFDFYGMNTQGVFLDPNNYKEKQFETLVEAQKCVSKASLEHQIKTLENMPAKPTQEVKDAIQQLLDMYREELAAYA